MRYKDLGIKIYREILRQKKELSLYHRVSCMIDRQGFHVFASYKRQHGASGRVAIVVHSPYFMANNPHNIFCQVNIGYGGRGNELPADGYEYEGSLPNETIIKEVMENCYKGFDKVLWNGGCIFSHRLDTPYLDWMKEVKYGVRVQGVPLRPIDYTGLSTCSDTINSSER